MLRKILLSLLGAAILCFFCISASASDYTPPLPASGTCGEDITWYIDESGTMTFQGTGDIPSYREYFFWDEIPVYCPWNAYKSQIKYIIISEGITGIGANSLQNCDNLQRVDIPASVRYIAQSSFNSAGYAHTHPIELHISDLSAWLNLQCHNSPDSPIFHTDVNVYLNDQLLTDVVIPSDVTAIPCSAFYFWSCLESVTIPDHVTSVGDSAFFYCPKLKSVKIESPKIAFGANTFSYCKNLQYVTFPEGMTSVSNGMFQNCSSLHQVVFPASLASIGSEAFSGCTGISKIVFSGAAPDIGSDAFKSVQSYVYYSSSLGGWEFIANRDYGGRLVWQDAPAKTGLYKDPDGVYRYYANGVFDQTKYGYVDYEGGKFLIVRGLVATGKSGLAQDPEHPEDWYYLSHGQVQLQYSGLAQYDGAWFYLDHGKLDTTLTAVVPYDGSLFLVARGRIVTEKNGLGQDPVTRVWYFFSHGQVQTQYTGLAHYDGSWFYVHRGEFLDSFNGTVEYNGKQFLVKNGTVIRQV